MAGTDKRTMAAAIMENRFTAASDALRDYIRAGQPKTAGSRDMATLHLVVRSLNDLGWAQNAAFSGYPIQAYSLMRPVLESMNLIDLFSEKPQLADDWAIGDHKSFAPWRVRELLGEGKKDHFYSFMSEHSHPRFAGLQLSIFKLVPGDGEEDGEQRALLHMTDLPYEITPVLMANAMPGVLLARLAAHVGHIRLTDQGTREGFGDVLRTVASSLRVGWTALEAVIDEEEADDPEAKNPLSWVSGVADMLDTLASQVRDAFEASDPRG